MTAVLDIPAPVRQFGSSDPTLPSVFNTSPRSPTGTFLGTTHLVVAPYTEPKHQLDLTSVDFQSALLSQALIHLAPNDNTYAVTPYAQALNWSEVFAQLRSLCRESRHRWTSQTFYVVEFRSKLQPLSTDDEELLFKLDKESHREATSSGGLLKYWFGSTADDAERRNLATCVWTNKEAAVAGGQGPWHKQARNFISRAYENIDVKGLVLTIENDTEAWRFTRCQ